MRIDLISQPRCSLHPAAHKRDKIVSFWDICALHRDDFPPRAAPGELKVQIPAPPGIRALPCCNSLAKKHQKRTFLPLFRCCLFCLRQWEGEEEKKKKNQVKNKAVPRLSQRKSSRHSEPAGAKLQLHPRGNSRGAPRVLPPARGTAGTGWEGARGHRVWAVHGVWGHPI